jgi:hypothetical protein
MSEVQDDSQIRVNPPGSRVRASGPVLVLAALFVAATFLAWYFTWFGRGLSDADITKYLSDTNNPRHVQHALLQVQQRMERGDQSARNWYPQIEALSVSPESEFRLTAAWLMGFDNQSNEFHTALLKLVKDSEPIVRRNAALALVRFNDIGGREELVSVLKPFQVKATAEGSVSSTLHAGSIVSRGTLLARVQKPDGAISEIRSPLPGRVNEITKPNSAQVSSGETILTLSSDEGSVWEALRGLSFVGMSEDLDAVRSYANSSSVSEKISEQAKLTVKAIESRQRK